MITISDIKIREVLAGDTRRGQFGVWVLDDKGKIRYVPMYPSKSEPLGDIVRDPKPIWFNNSYQS